MLIPPTRDPGFTLVEVVIALAFVSAVVAGLTQLTVVSLRVGDDARVETRATLLASAKVEELRTASRAGRASPSPAGALDEDVAGFSDRIDAAGHTVVDSDGAAGVFLRRWLLAELASGPSSSWLIQVRVRGPRQADVLLTTVAAVW